MKKSLIALAVMAAAGAASAQSSVTLFGIVDATLAFGRGNGTGSSDRFQLTNSGYNSSRLGFRGTEDLGGGMSASFWLEAGLANDNGAGGSTNTNNQTTGATGGGGLTFNRRSTVSLGGRWGELRLGRDYTPQFWNLTVFDPFGTNGVGSTQTLAGVSIPFDPLTGLLGSTSAPGVFYPTQVRASNSIGYFLPPNLGGIYGQVQYHSGENANNAGDNGDGYGLRIGFASGPFNVAAAYSKTDIGGSGDLKTMNIGGQYDFGMAKVMAHYSRDEIDIGAIDATGKGFLVGALVPVGAGEIRAAYSQYKFDSDERTRKFAIGYVHNLSKRTAVYTTVAKLRNNGGANSALNGATTGANDSSTGLDIGVRHSF